ncbi:hypothetical protein [bacterium endosymbiont of Bathymodiolus sp. 5 South]|jgi:hypothetical protein|uniref:hypothetical protein n=1 Tax=bacterium endosymbiont of Bathymodiolus sp. 5 South TaxID=1181670 RepID=UPI0010B04F77|nr:hypothetical protein [bacterium endosymbiont of Bathymodiolus sp. 5 South]CAC9448121.1 hypothetical protein [uncultured Gammaproteobacteria bacterium]CAC9650169.1 hypothetical protein [uncultured Gammaproteobacteria bacterium]SHN91749.1 hypothetical protein BCLUESOX_2075 [bacterium endosymbiont of Bathymodiolus sp. 5 South]SSC08595.1 hypothetical protein BTURTLESOX_1986 [bacterium endosymbiont of Bathymodiolus sp. 5 South]VVH56232.1 hypothetical protein BSPCLSOX_2731 [uncultured Gammaproteo
MNYLDKFQSRFIGVMQWDDCNALFDTLISNPADDWYLYDTTAVLPVATINAERLVAQLKSIKFIIETQHQERYCGIVYVDDLKNPNFVKIFHPNNLGKTCGSSEHPPIPQWLLSKIQPLDVVRKFDQPPEKQGFISKFLKL